MPVDDLDAARNTTKCNRLSFPNGSVSSSSGKNKGIFPIFSAARHRKSTVDHMESIVGLLTWKRMGMVQAVTNTDLSSALTGLRHCFLAKGLFRMQPITRPAPDVNCKRVLAVTGHAGRAGRGIGSAQKLECSVTSYCFYRAVTASVEIPRRSACRPPRYVRT